MLNIQENIMIYLSKDCKCYFNKHYKFNEIFTVIPFEHLSEKQGGRYKIAYIYDISYKFYINFLRQEHQIDVL